MTSRKGFTLMELLMVIVIIAVAMVVVVWMLNPAELLKQSRDANRIANLGSVNKAVSLYYSDALNNPTNLFMGTSSVVYLSIPDPSAGVGGSNCSNLGLVGNYHCVSPANLTKTDGTGWIPINFNSLSTGNVIASLPIDPQNTSSSGCLAYETDGINWQLAASPESQKDISQASTSFLMGTATNFFGTGPCPFVTYSLLTHPLLHSGAEQIAFDPNKNLLWSTNLGQQILSSMGNTSYVPTEYSFAMSASANPMAFDSNTNVMWTVNSAVSSKLQFMNDTTFATSTNPIAGTPGNIVFDPAAGTMWVANNDNPVGTVTIVNDTFPYASTTIAVGGSFPNGIAYDPTTRTVWTANNGNGTVTRISDTFPYATTTIAVGGSPYWMTFDSNTNTFWVADKLNGPIIVINNTPPYATSSVAVGTATFDRSIIFDPHSRSIWTLSNTAKTIVKISDTSPYATTTYTLSTTPSSLAYDSNTFSIWAAAANVLAQLKPNH